MTLYLFLFYHLQSPYNSNKIVPALLKAYCSSTPFYLKFSITLLSNNVTSYYKLF